MGSSVQNTKPTLSNIELGQHSETTYSPIQNRNCNKLIFAQNELPTTLLHKIIYLEYGSRSILVFLARIVFKETMQTRDSASAPQKRKFWNRTASEGSRHEKLTNNPCVARGQKYSKQIADIIWNYVGSGHNLGHGHNQNLHWKLGRDRAICWMHEELISWPI